MLPSEVLREIRKIVGAERVLQGEEDRACYRFDAHEKGPVPEVVVFPSRAEEVAEILHLANRWRFPVIPRGAGTGMTGGAVPVPGSLVLSFTKMNRIKEINVRDLYAIVEPGVINYEFQKEVEKVGLFFPPDPASYMYSTIGGNVAECAGGPRALKYGTMRDYVLGLEVVLPTGEVIHTGTKTVKGVVGYDLTRLFVGSEGTLGVITEVTLRLLPLPEAKGSLLAIFPEMEEAAGAVSEIFRAGIIPSAIEFMDRLSIYCARSFLEAELPEVGGLLLIEVDGPAPSISHQTGRIREVCLKEGAREVRIAASEEEAEELWAIRRCLSQASYALGPVKVNEDVVVLPSKIPDLIRGAQEIARSLNLPILCFGHAGDGNIHVNVMVQDDPEERRKAQEAVERIFRLALSLGGTLSGEHGIGMTKAPYLGLELSPATTEAMRRVKRALDPLGILNPGKIFPERGSDG